MDSPGDPALQWQMADRPVTADAALQHLLEGNGRFIRGEPRFASICKEKLADLAHAQRPYATIVGCSDSRVAPELVFDAGLGELFVIRVAGNVISPEVMGSVQYAAVHLQTPLFVVLGHEGCGAVSAALDAIHRGAQERSKIQRLLEGIIPGLREIRADLAPDEALQRGVEANVRWSMRQLLATPEAQARAAEGRMRLVGAVYEIATGRVRLLADDSARR
jgi:carbonic anhydrase